MDAVPMARGDTLPDDAILQILSRVADDDPAALFRCAVTCKPWRALVADPSFLLRRRWPDQSARDPSSLLGLFGQHQDSTTGWISCSSTFIRLTRDRRSISPFQLGSFGPCTGGLLHNAVPLASRQGLLLVQLFPQDPKPQGVHLALCNIYADTCDLLPPLNCAFFGITTSAILTDADYYYCCSNDRQYSPPSSRYSNSFKVLVIIEERGTRKFRRNHLYSFSSLESSWSTPRKSSQLIDDINLTSNTVVCRGKVHWLVRDDRPIWNLYTFDLRNEAPIHVCLTEVTIPHDQFQFSYYNRPLLSVTADGNLSMLSLHTKSFKLDIWTRRGKKPSDDGVIADWLRTNVIELKPMMPRIDEMACMCLCQRSGTVLILGQQSYMYFVNLETEVINKVPNQFCSLAKWNLVPFEMDWPAFFMSRLEVKTKGMKPE